MIMGLYSLGWTVIVFNITTITKNVNEIFGLRQQHGWTAGAFKITKVNKNKHEILGLRHQQ